MQNRSLVGHSPWGHTESDTTCKPGNFNINVLKSGFQKQILRGTQLYVIYCEDGLGKLWKGRE